MTVDITAEKLPESRRGRMHRIAVVGSGSWGTALAVVAATAGNEVRLWGRDAGLMDEIATTRRNARNLPDIDIPPNVTATADIGAAIGDAEAVLVVTPSKTLREMCRA